MRIETESLTQILECGGRVRRTMAVVLGRFGKWRVTHIISMSASGTARNVRTRGVLTETRALTSRVLGRCEHTSKQESLFETFTMHARNEG